MTRGLPVGWIPNFKLGDACRIKHGYAFKGDLMTTQDCELPVVVNIVNFQYTGGFRFQSTKVQRYRGDYPKEYEMKPGQILVVMTCQTPKGEILGVPGRIPNDGRIYLHNQRMGLPVITDPKKLDMDFLYWLFISPRFNAHLFSTATGAKILHTAPSRIGSYVFSLPPLPTQRKIASILSAYDDLIENNTCRIQILEEMARAIYTEWFVNFRFPGHEKVKMVESQLGKIPEGWEVSTLGSMCQVVMGQSPKSDFYNTSGGGLPFHQGVTDFGERFVSHRVYCTINHGRIAEQGDILFSVRAPVGRLNIASSKMLLGRGLCGLRCRTAHQEFVFQALKYRFQEEDSMGSGSIFNAVTKQDVHGIKMLLPDHRLLDLYEYSVEPITTLIVNLTERNHVLRRTLDLLLPKLVSGDVDVTKPEIKDSGGEN
ncbi:MAG: restriction endonuclease subunit S [Armatimonadetes bacterium]|nr:restriction endonuclease subunit S [Armatimonadota bacterium]